MGFYGRRKTVVKRSKDVIEAEKAAKLALSKTCQICARPIFAETGVIAHHGYQRPEGWHSQTASCLGARHAPFEVSCEVLRGHVGRQRERLENLIEMRGKLNSDLIPAIFTYKTRAAYKADPKTIRLELTPENFTGIKAENSSVFMTHSLHSYEDAKGRDLRNRDQNIKSLREYCEWQEGRVSAWTQTYRREAGEWVAL